MTDKYILDGKKVVPEPDLYAWGEWFKKADRKVARNKTDNGDVSTVFLGLDHSFGDGPPLLFETLVFGGPLKDEMNRYSTYDEAVAGHVKMLARVKEAAA